MAKNKIILGGIISSSHRNTYWLKRSVLILIRGVKKMNEKKEPSKRRN